MELKVFTGEKVETTEGLKWHVKLGCPWRTVTTYVVPGQTPFLMSRRVLEGIKACLDLGKKTISSIPHNMKDVPLRQAANGNFLMPLCDLPDELDVQNVGETEPQSLSVDVGSDGSINEPNANDHDDEQANMEVPPVPQHDPKDHGSRKAVRSVQAPAIGIGHLNT